MRSDDKSVVVRSETAAVGLTVDPLLCEKLNMQLQSLQADLAKVQALKNRLFFISLCAELSTIMNCKLIILCFLPETP